MTSEEHTENAQHAQGHERENARREHAHEARSPSERGGGAIGANAPLYAVIVVAVLALAALGYAAMQGDSFNKRIALVEQQQNAANAKVDQTQAAIAQMNSKLSDFDAYIKARLTDLEVTLTVYYDSDCAFCENDRLTSILDSDEPTLKKNGITLQRIDVRSDYDAILAKGIDRVPAFYASAQDLSKGQPGKNLKDFIDSLEQSGFNYYYVKDGIAMTPRTVSEMLSAPCLSDKMNVEYFYSETCEYCKRVKYANGTIANSASDPAFQNVLEESLQKVEGDFAGTLNVTRRCLAVHSSLENEASIKVNKSDEELCVETQGKEKADADEQTAAKYHLQPPTAPLFAVNCKYLFSVKATTPDAITEPICILKPSLAFCKTSVSPVPSPAPTSQPSA
jgi:glutaredoxin